MILKVIFANIVDPDQTAALGPHCLPVCKTRFEKSARIFSRWHKQTTFSDAVFLGALRVKFLGDISWTNFWIHSPHLLASVAQLDAGLTGDQEVADWPQPGGNIFSWRLIMKYFLWSFSPFCWFKKVSYQLLAKECALSGFILPTCWSW